MDAVKKTKDCYEKLDISMWMDFDFDCKNIP